VTPASIVSSPLAALAAGIVLELLLARVLSARAKGWLAFAAGLGALAGVVAAWPAVGGGGAVDVRLGAWDGPVQLAYHVDALGFLFALMGAGIGSAVLLYSVGYMAHEARGTTRFYALVLVFVAGLVHLVYAADLFLVYLSWEVVGLCSFLLVGFWYQDPAAASGARKVLTITHLAGYGLLAAVVLLYARTGSTLWTDPRMPGAFTTGVFLLVLVAALAKSVQFPLHTWIPFAMAAPTPVSALLHAACYVKAGVYLVARMHAVAPWAPSWGAVVSWIGAATLLGGALFMLAQRDLKRLLAFSTVSQIGYMMLGLGLGTPLGIAGGLLHCLNHGLFKGGLFLCAGAVQHACGTREMDRLGGLGRKMPRTFALWLVGAAGITGVPLLNGFVSKWLLYDAALEAGQPFLALAAWVGSILTVFSFLKATSGVFLGEDGPATAEAHEAPGTMIGGGAVLAAGCVVLGVAPQLAVTYLLNPLLPALGRAPIAGVSWLGLSVGQGAFFATGGLVLGVVALLFGAVVYWLPLPARAALMSTGGAPSVFTGGEPQGHLGASDFSRIVEQSLAPFYRGFDADRYWLAAWRALGAVADRVAALLRPAERVPVAAAAALAVALGAAALLRPAAGPVAAAAAGHGAAAALAAPLAVAVAVALAGLLLACAALPGARRLLAPVALAGGLAVAGVLVVAPAPRVALLEGAAVVALLVLWRASPVAAARRAYLAAVVLSALGLAGGAAAAARGQEGLAFALLLPGFAVKLALVPLWLWLPLVAEATPALVTGLVVAVVDVAAFGELLTLRIAEPALFAPGAPWLALGVASAVLGALLGMAQRELKRLLAFSTIQDMGLLVVAAALAGEHGVAGAALGAGVHAVGKALLFASVAAPEAEGAPLLDARGLAVRHPVAAAGFLVGALSVLGVPPTVGFSAHWRVFSALAGSPALLAVLSGAAMLSVAVYARAVALFWWGPESGAAPPAARPARPYHRPLLSAAVLLLSAALLAAGLWPRLLGGGL
jgi:multicomponent Na+:H+ antiporter subunit A